MPHFSIDAGICIKVPRFLIFFASLSAVPAVFYFSDRIAPPQGKQSGNAGSIFLQTQPLAEMFRETEKLFCLSASPAEGIIVSLSSCRSVGYDLDSLITITIIILIYIYILH